MLRALWKRIFGTHGEAEKPPKDVDDIAAEEAIQDIKGIPVEITVGPSITDNLQDSARPREGEGARKAALTAPSDWRESSAHLLFLTDFIRPRALDEPAWSTGYWDSVLGESPWEAVKRFLDEGILVPVDVNHALDHKFTVPQLKEMLRERGLKVSGRKAELITRLVEADPDGMKEIAVGLSLVWCSEQGRKIAEQYLAEQEEERAKVQQQVRELLKAHEFEQASRIVANYEAKQVFPRGLNIDWKHHDPARDVEILKAIFTSKPKALGQVSEETLEVFRMYAATEYLWGTTEKLQAIDEVRLISSDAQFRVNIAEFRRRGVRTVEIQTADDKSVCPECRALEGRTFMIDEVPSLPYERCTSEFGCRCWAVEADF